MTAVDERTAPAPPVDAPTEGVRDALGTVRDLDDSKREALVSIPWETIDTYNTDFERSCFDDYLSQRLPVVCWQHDKKEPIGRVASWQKGERANEFVLRFSDFDAVPRARQAYVQMRDRDVEDISFYFDQAKAVPHPQTRGAARFVKARMPEISPVTVGSIPGAVVTGVRQAADFAGVAELVRAGVIDEAEGRRMLGLSGDVPTLTKRETIELAPTHTGIAIGTGATTTTGARGVTLTVNGHTITLPDSPADSTDSTAADTTDDDSLNLSDPNVLIAEVDAGVDTALAYLEQTDLAQLPAEVNIAYRMLQNVDEFLDAYMDAAGIPDADDNTRADTDEDSDEAGERASKKPYGDVDYADPGYQKDKQKRYPLDTAEHVRAAWSYINQADNAGQYTAEQLDAIKAKIKAAAKKAGVQIEDSKRSADDIDVATQVALAKSKLRRR